MPEEPYFWYNYCMKNQKTGVVVVGTGLIARFHAQAVKASAKLELVAAVDLVRERAEKFAAEFGCAAYEDVDAALSRPDAGMVSVAERPPSNSHVDWPFRRPPERVPEVPVVSREHLPQLKAVKLFPHEKT